MLIDLITSKLEIEAINALKLNYFDLNAQDKYKKNILMYACEHELHNLINEILLLYKKDKNLNINLLDHQGQTALYYACTNKDIHTIDKLIEAGLDIDSINKEIQTALNFSARHNLTQVITSLLCYSKDTSVADRLRRTPLIWACKLKNKAAAQHLLIAGANHNKFDESNMSSLFYAADNNDNDIIDLLLKYGANINLRNDIGKTVLHHAAQYNLISVIQKIIDLKAKINPIDERGKTPLMYSCEFVNKDISKILILNGAKFSFKNKYDLKGFDALLEDLELFQFLLDNTFSKHDLIQYRNSINQLMPNKLKSNYEKHLQLIDTYIFRQKLKSKLAELNDNNLKKIKI